MSTGLLKFKKKYGTDPEVSIYIKNNYKIDIGIYYKGIHINSKNKSIEHYILLPYVNNKWTESKLSFGSYQQLTNFSKKLNFELRKKFN